MRQPIGGPAVFAGQDGFGVIWTTAATPPAPASVGPLILVPAAATPGAPAAAALKGGIQSGPDTADPARAGEPDPVNGTESDTLRQGDQTGPDTADPTGGERLDPSTN